MTSRLRTGFLLLFLTACASSPRPPEHFVLDWPVDNARLTQRFKTENKLHLGLDLAWKLNSPVKAAHDGVVVYAGSAFRGFGKMVLIENRNGWATLYGHLNHLSVKTGQRVSRGRVIGKMGRTGRASGVHLHFEIRHNKIPVDPLKVLPQSVLRSRVASL